MVKKIRAAVAPYRKAIIAGVVGFVVPFARAKGHEVPESVVSAVVSAIFVYLIPNQSPAPQG